jgi:hypothetical protein
MKKYNYILIVALFFCCKLSTAQFLHPTTGINSEYVGACETATCGGTYFDNGGVGGNYSTFIGYPSPGGVYRTFCPDAATKCVRMTFTAFDVEFGAASCPFDYLTVGNGPTQNSTLINALPANGAGKICGTPAVPFSYTSTDPSGCLTFRFYSDNTVTRPGWSANITCVGCATGPLAGTNSDCDFATPVCASGTFSDNSTGPGIVAEGCNGATCPAGGENYSNWYQVLFATSGTFLFTIAPFVGGADYDFNVYGPNKPCSALGVPVRCNDSGTPGNTGCSAAGTNPTEIVTGPPFCSPMNVIAGETYYICIDSWSPPASPAGYNITWGGTSTFNCAILPVKMTRFDASYNMQEKKTELFWETLMESNIRHFAIERSTDAINFTEIGKVLPYSIGGSKEKRSYYTTDPTPVSNEINYYRIITMDYDGNKSISTVKAVMFQDDEANLSLVPNPANNKVDVKFRSAKDKNWAINFYDHQGNNLKTIGYTSIVNGINTFSMDIDDLKSGMYFVNITDGVNQFKRKLIKE